MPPSEINPAAVLPGELPFLVQVARDPNDDAAKLVYADWLEEHRDRRGEFLRAYVAAARGEGVVLPEPSGAMSSGWLDLIGYSLTERLGERGLDHHREVLLTLTRPALAIVTEPWPEERFPLGATKVGGLPSLPPGAGWPRSGDGPFRFLAQFNLAELRGTVAGQALPAGGLLSFFMYQNIPDDIHGEDAEGLRVLYTPPGERLAALSPPADLTEDLGAPGEGQTCRIRATEALDTPCRLEQAWLMRRPDRFPADLGQLGSRDLLSPALEEADHLLFGHTHVSVLAGDPTPGPEWRQLVQFSSDDNPGWGWGDGHRLFWYIRAADLRARRFEDTVAVNG